MEIVKAHIEHRHNDCRDYIFLREIYMDDREELIAIFQKECIDCYGELLRAEIEKALDERYENQERRRSNV